mmetsp:Transcript_132693/g.331010  ORF Transcript_132693/g.331010 Transcript_132693/m.331010 type:complete len:233 (+) Transcript_132693:1037-1735(+)
MVSPAASCASGAAAAVPAMSASTAEHADGEACVAVSAASLLSVRSIAAACKGTAASAGAEAAADGEELMTAEDDEARVRQLRPACANRGLGRIGGTPVLEPPIAESPDEPSASCRPPGEGEAEADCRRAKPLLSPVGHVAEFERDLAGCCDACDGGGGGGGGGCRLPLVRLSSRGAGAVDDEELPLAKGGGGGSNSSSVGPRGLKRRSKCARCSDFDRNLGCSLVLPPPCGC